MLPPEVRISKWLRPWHTHNTVTTFPPVNVFWARRHVKRAMLQICPLCQRVLGLPTRFRLRRLSIHRVTNVVQSRRYASDDPKIDLSQFPVENIRNFSIVAHIDHGKSTLADRLLEFTGTIPVTDNNRQVLDRLQVERERGITVKAQTASLIFPHQGTNYLLNLVDTPGHVDFSYEVSRSLAACQGAVLLVDANQGVQAQTVANFYLAFEADLAIVPVLNKIDLPNAKPDLVKQQLLTAFDIEPDTVLQISAKKGIGIKEVLQAVVERVPCPSGKAARPLRALLFDSCYDKYRGVVAHMAIVDGALKKGDKITSNNSKKQYEVQEIGVLQPDEVPTGVLYAGQVGYIICNMRNTAEARVGDTFFHPEFPVTALPGFKPAKPMVFAGVFPSDQSEFVNLRSAIERLTLNDASVTVHADSSPALGQGFRLGFLGLLHMDVFQQRLEQEHSTSVVVTAPNVPYRAKVFGAKNIKKYGGNEVTVLNPCHLPDPSITEELMEPMVIATIITPDGYLGSITRLCLERRGVMKDQTYIDNQRIMLRIKLPLNEILVDFFDELKSLSSGYASLDYEDAGYEVSNLIRVDFMLNGKVVDELTMVAHTSRARLMARQVCARLKEVIPRQLYAVTIQGSVGSKVIAREDVKPLRKDVLAKCYGGDITRKMKLLRRQAEGKKRMRMIGNIEVPKDAFISALKK